MSITIIASFIFFTALVGIITYFKTRGDKVDSKDGYFLGGRSLTAGIIGGSLLLTNLSAGNFVGMSAQAYTNNMCVMGWEVTSGVVLVLVALFLVPRYLKAGITTIPDFLEDRFDSGVKKFVSILFLLGYVVNVLPPTLYSGAIAMSQIFNVSGVFGVSYTTGIWITVWAIGIIGSIYAIFGGLKAVAVSDTLNGIGLVIGGLMVPFFGLVVLGKGHFLSGLNKIIVEHQDKLNAVGTVSDPVPFATLFTGMLLVNLYYWGTDQAIIQRALGAKNLKEGQKGVILAGFLKVLTPLMVIIPGIIAFHMYGAGASNPDLMYSKLVNDVMPKPLIGFFGAVMFGAILSTFNSVLNSASTLFALNVYKPIFGKNKSDMDIVNEGKKFGIILAIISMFIEPFIMYAPEGLFQYLQTVNGFFNVPIFTIIFIGYATKRVPAIAAKISLTFFVFTYGILQLVIKPELHFLHQLAILFIISCIIMPVIGKIRPNKEEYVLKDKKVVDIHPWEHRHEASGIVIFTMITMYILFSKIGIVSKGGMHSKGIAAIIIAAVVTIICVKISKSRDKTILNNKNENIGQ
ncbi:solute:sodium symporter family transporter [Clostridium botulinum]|uniref:Transporter n=1 Tax=Clostridium botulinum C/D str. DC5 TaxID=1443128 RepID=A0A0A0IE28_CLOBO|nr:solute:sodium symporter family transporter [Clostridium botulinum]KGM99704.1 transporter [Clostridium botulinum C/D str. DC5]KOC52958.1 transporter [Clostridium botulinum]KOC58006.1 transporter [Clostridium botulinum]MCD3234094.1 solute:sodium symporter family transporter [Clostridium botulinum D/C]MCD3239931.1 solute:sodium symporter family transporter [Clostridium botulinum D/C]